MVHPAFTANTDLGGTGEEITGFWVGKFESSNVESPRNNEGITANSNQKLLYGYGNRKDITIRPNVTSWRNTDIISMFNVSQNSQRGAITYLVQSEYGNIRKTDNESGIWNNSYSEGITFKAQGAYGCSSYGVDLTGMAGEARNDNTFFYSNVKKKTDKGDCIEIEYVKINNDGTKENGYTATEGEKYTKEFWKYYTEKGQRASTTRNIYGIYDMSAGSWECMASYLENATINEYVKQIKEKNKKYQTGYKGNQSTISAADKQSNYDMNKEKYGDSIWEISHFIGGEAAWYSANVSYPSFESPFFKFGGTASGAKTGVFSFFGSGNGIGAVDTFRIIIL